MFPVARKRRSGKRGNLATGPDQNREAREVAKCRVPTASPTFIYTNKCVICFREHLRSGCVATIFHDCDAQRSLWQIPRRICPTSEALSHRGRRPHEPEPQISHRRHYHHPPYPRNHPLAHFPPMVPVTPFPHHRIQSRPVLRYPRLLPPSLQPPDETHPAAAGGVGFGAERTAGRSASDRCLPPLWLRLWGSYPVRGAARRSGPTRNRQSVPSSPGQRRVGVVRLRGRRGGERRRRGAKTPFLEFMDQIVRVFCSSSLGRKEY